MSPFALALAMALGAAVGAQQDATVTLEGRVVDLRGEPVPLAEVWVERWQEPGRRLGEGRCDGDGLFRIGRVPAREHYEVRATATGRCVAADVVRRQAAILRLHDGATVRGVLRDAAGEPVAGAVVRVLATGRVGGVADVVVTTAADGAFVAEKVALGPTMLTAAVPGEGHYLAHVAVGGDAEVDLLRAPGATTTLRIAIPALADEARDDVWIHLLPNGLVSRLPPPWDRPRLDRDGRCELTDVPDTNYWLEPYSPGWAFAPQRVDLAAGQGPHAVEFVATRVDTTATRVRARLRDARGQPLAGVVLSMGRHDGPRSRATTAADGTATLVTSDAVGAGSTLAAADDRWVLDQAGRRSGSAAVHSFVIDPGRLVELRAVPACSVGGRVLRPDGGPAAFALVALERRRAEGMPAWLQWTSARADRRGSFRFGRLHHLDEAVRVRVVDDAGCLETAPHALDESGTELELGELRLGAPAVVEGSITDPALRPVAGVRVWLRAWDLERGHQANGGLREVVTDRRGRYRFVGVPVGGAFLQLVAGVDDLAPREAVAPFAVEAGKRYTFDLEDRP